jgi:hypothetical protein
LVCDDGAGGNWESVCHSCDESNEALSQVAIYFAIIVAILLVVGFLFKKCVPRKSQKSLQIMFKIVFAGSQILSAIPDVFDIKLPSQFEDL